MEMSNTQSNDIIFILGNKDYKIKYSNMDDESTQTYIKKLNILDNLNGNLPLDYILEGYHVKVDEYMISDEVHNIVAIRLKRDKCENCVKASIDSVTGLYNRNYLEQVKMEGSLLDIKNSFLILIDIDDLKGVNDNYGHLVGDKAIEIVGKSIITSIRKDDIGIRYGGDEFIVVVFNQKESSIRKVVERIKKEIKRRSIGEGVDVEVSAGIAYCSCSIELEEVINMADRELYKEKKIKQKEINLGRV